MDNGLKYEHICYDLCRAAQNEEMLSSTLNNLGNIYMINKQDSVAITYFKKSLEIERKLGRIEQQAIRLRNISSAYVKTNQLPQALEAATEGLKLSREAGRIDRIAIRLHQLSEVYMAMNDYKRAKECEIEANGYFKKVESAYGQAITLNSLGKIEQTTGNHAGDDSISSLCRILEENAKEQVSTIENLMNWARVQTNRIHYTPQYFDIVSVISDEIKRYALAAQNKSIHIHTHLPESCVVFADKQMIIIVLQNLLNNAVKFTRETGTIAVSGECSQQEATITVQDDGVGMSRQQIDALYTDRQQVEVRFGTKGEKGTGLGLALCKDLLERNNSRLLIDSQEQKGITIRFSLNKTI